AVAPGAETPSGAVVSFATGSVPPPQQPSTASTPPAPLLASISTPPESKANRRSATLFRCWRCKVMVEADAGGPCPRRGAPAPKMASAPMSVVNPSAGRGLLIAAAVAGLAVIAMVATPRLLDRLRHPSEPVAGEFHSPHLGVSLLFPDEWRHLREA